MDSIVRRHLEAEVLRRSENKARRRTLPPTSDTFLRVHGTSLCEVLACHYLAILAGQIKQNERPSAGFMTFVGAQHCTYMVAVVA